MSDSEEVVIPHLQVDLCAMLTRLTVRRVEMPCASCSRGNMVHNRTPPIIPHWSSQPFLWVPVYLHQCSGCGMPTTYPRIYPRVAFFDDEGREIDATTGEIVTP